MKTYSILLVEDDEIDVITIERAFKKANILNPLFQANNGIEALKMLREDKIPAPTIILLDLNMPQMNGLEFLEEIRKDQKLCVLPIIVLTSSKRDEDVASAYKSYVAGYLLKPVSMEDFVETMAIVGKYWALCEIDQYK